MLFFGIILGRHFNDFYRLLIITVINHEKKRNDHTGNVKFYRKLYYLGSMQKKTEYSPEFEIAVQ